MTRGDAKTIRIRCGTWDQVEAFYSEKVLANRGNILVVKMPFRPGIGEPMTVALTLPDGLVFAIDGVVVKMGADDAGRIPVAVRLHGLSGDVRSQLKRLVAQARGQLTPVGGTRAVGTRPPETKAEPKVEPRPRAVVETVPPPSDPSLREVVEEERELFDELVALRERLCALPAHEVLGVPADAGGERTHAAYLALAMRVHPDRFRRRRSAALRVLAADMFVLARRALDSLAPSAGADDGWLHSLPDGSEPDAAADSSAPVEPMPATGSAPYSEMSITRPAPGSSYEDEVTFTTSVRMRALTAEELFDEEPTPTTPVPKGVGLEAQAHALAAEAAGVPPASPTPVAEISLEANGRAALAETRWRDACEAFAAVLRAEPRNRVVRALYHVASGMEMRARGEGVKARLQFETALAHDKDCEEARRALLPEQPGEKKGGILKRLFDK